MACIRGKIRKVKVVVYIRIPGDGLGTIAGLAQLVVVGGCGLTFGPFKDEIVRFGASRG